MSAGATNRSIGRLITDVADGILIPRPEFQRRLVWNDRDKNHFVQTVLLGLPFPEIYVATGSMDVETGRGKELLVDGQQRLTTLLQYFQGSKLLKLQRDVQPYKTLPKERKIQFLEYPVAVRELGSKSDTEIQEIFKRINATAYSLNDMEINNAVYQGPFRQFAQKMSELDLFEKHKIFTIRETRRMLDVAYLITVIISMMRSYPNRDDDHEGFLAQYNEEFPEACDIRRRVAASLSFIEQCEFPPRSRAWRNADFLALVVEVDRILEQSPSALEATVVAPRLTDFYAEIDSLASKAEKDSSSPPPSRAALDYHLTTLQATGDRQNRISRGKSLRSVLTGENMVIPE
jgi:hypothetical protein